MDDVRSALIKNKVVLEGEWAEAEAQRVLAVMRRIETLAGRNVASVFNGQETIFRHSSRSGRVGRTIGGTVELDAEWTDWTLAHELGHRWNNAWQRSPERDLRTRLQAGRLEWLKRPLRRFEKWLERALGSKTARLASTLVSYRQRGPTMRLRPQLNASEDLAECLRIRVPEVAKERAAKATKEWRNQNRIGIG